MFKGHTCNEPPGAELQTLIISFPQPAEITSVCRHVTILAFSLPRSVGSRHSECRLSISELHPIIKTVISKDGCHGACVTSPLQWKRQRVGLITAVITTRASSLCAALSDAVRRVSTLENGNKTPEMEEVLETVLQSSSCCCIYLTRLVLAFFLVSSSSPSSHRRCSQCFLMNYHLTPQC